MIGPGLLLAATGVGGADMATGSIAGSLVGTSILWAVILGSLMKFIITEGLARWQLATGETFLEGVRHHFGPYIIWLFIPYLLLWSCRFSNDEFLRYCTLCNFSNLRKS